MINSEPQEAREPSGLFSFKSLHNFWENVIDLVFPPRCQHCERVDTRFCSVCESDLHTVPLEIILSDVPPLEAVMSSGLHDGLLQSGVQALKYNRQEHLGILFAQRLAASLKQENWHFDFVIPVPLHTERLQKRGYNQAEAISQHLAQLCQKQHRTDLLLRHSQTQSQVGLNQQERIENVKEAFQVTSNLEGAIILLVDDVKTTGATMASCAEILLANGAKAVYGITVSTAGRSQ